VCEAFSFVKMPAFSATVSDQKMVLCYCILWMGGSVCSTASSGCRAG
jgi:hypothetical protein